MAVAFLPSALRDQWVSCSYFMKNPNMSIEKIAKWGELTQQRERLSQYDFILIILNQSDVPLNVRMLADLSGLSNSAINGIVNYLQYKKRCIHSERRLCKITNRLCKFYSVKEGVVVPEFDELRRKQQE